MAIKANNAPDPTPADARPLPAARRIALSNTRRTKPEKPSVSLDPSGRLELSVSATRSLVKIAEGMGFAPGHFLVDVNVYEDDFASFTPVPLRTPGAGKISLYKSGTSAVQIAEVFDEYPQYQPVVRQRFTPIFNTDIDGKPCVSIGMKLGQDFHKTPRKPSEK